MVIFSKIDNLLLETFGLLDGEFNGESNDINLSSKRLPIFEIFTVSNGRGHHCLASY